jgi:hypothetical protein
VNYDLVQDVINRAVNLATRRALNGSPVAGITWIPPQTASADPCGAFVIVPCPPLSASDTAPWDYDR